MKHTEKEINDAIAVVQQALRDRRILEENGFRGWHSTSQIWARENYRAKPDLVEGWVHIRDLRDYDLIAHGKPEDWIKVREVTDEG